MHRILITIALALPITSCASSKGNVYPLDLDYLRPNTFFAEIQNIATSHPDLVKLHLIGLSSVAELPIHALQIGSDTAAQRVLIIGQHHGDEVLGVELAVAFARELCEKAQERRYKAILGQYQFWIIPTLNPEGYRSVTSGEFAWKRKNNTDSNKNGKFELRTDGVDLNRNYPVFWENDRVVQPENPYFKGASPASEGEIQALIGLCERVRFDIAIFYHSSSTGAYSERIYLPWHDPTDPDLKARFQENKELAERYAILVPKDYERGSYEVHQGYNSKLGNARNFFFYTYDTQAFLVEIGGINQFGISVIHPEKKMKRENVRKHLGALKSFFYDLVE